MISDILNIKRGLTSIIGSGGKTSLMYALAEELSAESRVIVCTTAKIYAPEHIITLYDPSEEEIKRSLYKNGLICVGKAAENGKLILPDIDFSEILKYADYILCEADGSRGLPLKAHEVYEPVIPKESVETIQVMGVKGIGGKIKNVCHRAELYAELTGLDTEYTVTPQIAAKVINAENLCHKLVINQVENETVIINASETAKYINVPVFAGEIRKGRLKCLQ